MKLSSSFIVTLLATLALVSPTMAAGKGDGIKGQEKAARKACLAGDYDKGVTLLSDLFVETKNPVYLFNRGRCFQQNRRYEDALASFQEYLRVASKSDPGAYTSAQQYIAECRTLIEQQNPKAPAPPESAPSVQAATPSAPLPAPAVSPAAEPVQPEPPLLTQPAERPVDSNPGSGLRTAGIIVGGLGVGGIVAGVLLNAKVNEIASDLEKPGKYTDGRESDRKTYETWGWVSYGLGAACLTTGAVLTLVGYVSGKPASVALVPSVGPGQTGAVVRGAF
jgi:hypothetical protein